VACKVEKEKLTTDGAKAVAVAVVERAVLDLAGRGVGGAVACRTLTWNDYVKAVMWLASSRATIWFDILSLNQGRCLLNLDWPEHAGGLIGDERADLTADQEQFLRDGIKVLHTLGT
tara:strand:- start:1357 stop:1707 length:351 start_codon:yes stop_codon:yes gene_type:complete